jgi:ABC-type Fe3+-siderophore transport system permease subunit
VAVWIALGAVIGLAMQALVKLPSARPGHTAVIAVFGSFGAVIGGMLGVGILEFEDPRALSLGGMVGAVFLSVLLTWTYRWGSRSAT